MTTRIVQRIACVLGVSALRILALARRDGSVPLSIVRKVRSVLAFPDVLARRSVRIDGSTVADPDLARMLAGITLGTWAFGPRTIEFLGEYIGRHRPRLVVEFGSGVSTLALAHFLATTGAEGGKRLVALEQDPEHAARTRRLLKASGLDDSVVVVVAPLSRVTIGGKSRVTYTPTETLLKAVGGRSPDLLVVDGPAAETGGRFATVAVVRCRPGHTRIVMDDALRDSELDTAAEWSELGLVTVDGIRPIDKGILVGTLAKDPSLSTLIPDALPDYR